MVMNRDFSNDKESDLKNESATDNQDTSAVFPVFYSCHNEYYMLMFETLEGLNGYLELQDIESIQKHKCWDIKGYRCTTIIDSDLPDDLLKNLVKKHQWHKLQACLLPIRILTEPHKQELAEEMYKYAVYKSKSVAQFVCKGILKYRGSKEDETEMEQTILDEIFETNFLYSELNDEAIKKFYDEFCNCL
jgi:hypothetical protein